MSTLRSILVVVVVVTVGYWYWSGPYQERANPTPQQKVRQNTEALSECIRRKHYADTRMATDSGDLEEKCRRELNLYFEDGEWHSYDDVRGD